MEEREIIFRKKREIGEVIADSFEFLKQNLSSISRIIAIYVLPFLLLYAGALVYFQRNILSKFDLSNPEIIMKNIGPFYLNIFLFLLFVIFIQSLFAGTYFSYLEAYIKHGKGNFNLSDISPNFFTNGLLALRANLIFLVIVILGGMMCFLPAIFFANTFSLIVFINIFEKKGIGNALSVSWKLVNSNWWNTLLVNLVSYLIVIVANVILSLPVIIMESTNPAFSPAANNQANYPTLYWVFIGLSGIITTAMLIIPFTFQAFQYFNLAERTATKLPTGQQED